MRLALLGLVLFILPLILFPPNSLGQEDGTSLEYQVKGAYLYNFTKFVDWPAETFQNSSSPFSLCVLGIQSTQSQSPFSPDFEKQLREKKVHDRSIEIRHVTNSEDAALCQILFVPVSQEGRFQELLENIKGKSILLVGETSDFDQQGGMIQFVLENGRVRFIINLPSALNSGLQISSKLLQVAK